MGFNKVSSLVSIGLSLLVLILAFYPQYSDSILVFMYLGDIGVLVGLLLYYIPEYSTEDTQ